MPEELLVGSNVLPSNSLLGREGRFLPHHTVGEHVVHYHAGDAPSAYLEQWDVEQELQYLPFKLELHLKYRIYV